MVLDLGYNISLIYLNLSDFFEKSNVITRPSKSKAHFSFWQNPHDGFNMWEKSR